MVTHVKESVLYFQGSEKCVFLTVCLCVCVNVCVYSGMCIFVGICVYVSVCACVFAALEKGSAET